MKKSYLNAGLRLATMVLLIVLSFCARAQDCTQWSSNMVGCFPTTINGITVSYSGKTVGPSGGTYCGFSAGPTPCGTVPWTGNVGPGKMTFTFSQPVNNITMALTAFGVISSSVADQVFITTNGGNPSIQNVGGCIGTISGNSITGRVGSAHMVVQFTAPAPFTSLVISEPVTSDPSDPSDAGNGGIDAYICSLSVQPICAAGTTAPSLITNSISNNCPTSTVNLNSLFTGTPPSGSSLVWFTDNAHTNAYSTPTTAAQGTYYAFFYDAANNCYSQGAGPVNATIGNCICTTTPQLSDYNPANICPATTVDLTKLVANNLPSGATLVWFTNSSHTLPAYATPAAATQGTYYANFYDAANNCYGPATVVVNASVNSCICTTQPQLSNYNPANICPANTVDLTKIVANNLPSGATLVWFTNSSHTLPAYATPAAATQGTYYANFYDAANNCYGPATVVVNASVNSCICTTQPQLSNYNPANICPANTVDLTKIVANNLPSGATLVWFTNSNHTLPAYATPAAATQGTYYANFYDAANNCYGPATVVVNATVNNTCICNTQPTLTTTTVNSICASNTVNLNSYVSSSLPSGATLVWFTNSNHALPAYATPTTAGQGSYWAYYYDAANNCYGPASAQLTVAATKPTLSNTNPTIICPATTIDLNSLVVNPVSGYLILWYTNPQGTGSSVFTSSGPGTYYAFYYDQTHNCFGPASDPVTVGYQNCTGPGTCNTNPTVSTTSLQNLCPATTANLTGIASAAPAGSVLEWYSDAKGNNIVTDITKVGAGTYYAVYHQLSPNCWGPNSQGVKVTITNPCPVSPLTVNCGKTQLSPAPVAGTASQGALTISVNVSTPGCYNIAVSGSGMSLANNVTQICVTTTGTQYVVVPVKYDGVTALGTMTFTLNNDNTLSCTADLTKMPKTGICNIWTLDCVPTVGPALK
ncbi:MAG: hypothetical protein QM726_08365 [Chitinophagaceae bacterium]